MFDTNTFYRVRRRVHGLCVGSVLSIGSAGSILSIGSAGSSPGREEDEADER